jgi:hypothetical protein
VVVIVRFGRGPGGDLLAGAVPDVAFKGAGSMVPGRDSISHRHHLD